MQNSDNFELILDIQRLPENSLALRNLANEASNILSILNNMTNLKDKVSLLEKEQNAAVKNLQRSSQNSDATHVKTLYDHAIAQETAQANIDRIMSDKMMSQKQKQNSLEKNKSIDARSDTQTIENKITSLYDEAISKITSQSPIEILNLDIQALKYRNSLEQLPLHDYLSRTASILWKRGAVTTKSITAMVKSVVTSSKANVSAKAQKPVIDNATAHIPPQDASPTQVAQWIENYITQPISNLITKARGNNNSGIGATSSPTNS